MGSLPNILIMMGTLYNVKRVLWEKITKLWGGAVDQLQVEYGTEGRGRKASKKGQLWQEKRQKPVGILVLAHSNFLTNSLKECAQSMIY